MGYLIPGKLIEITAALDDVFRIGRVDFQGTTEDINLAMVPEAKIGDYVLVHIKAAISVIDEEEAKETFALIRQMDELDHLEDGLP